MGLKSIILINLINFCKIVYYICLNQLLKTQKSSQAKGGTQSIETLDVHCVY